MYTECRRAIMHVRFGSKLKSFEFPFVLTNFKSNKTVNSCLSLSIKDEEKKITPKQTHFPRTLKFYRIDHFQQVIARITNFGHVIIYNCIYIGFSLFFLFKKRSCFQKMTMMVIDMIRIYRSTLYWLGDCVFTSEFQYLARNRLTRCVVCNHHDTKIKRSH